MLLGHDPVLCLAAVPWRTVYSNRMKSRREFLLLLLILPVGPKALAQRSDRPAGIAVLAEGIDPRVGAPSFWTQFHKRLGELGHVEGTTYVMEFRWDMGDRERLPALASELVTQKPDVIISTTTPPTQALKRATGQLPIVTTASDPVKTGLIASLGKPGGNITGSTVHAANFYGKLLELLREIAPKASSVGVLADTGNPASKLAIRELQEIVRPLDVAVRALDARNTANVESAFKTIARDSIDGLIVDVNPLILRQRQQIVDAAARRRIPAVYARREYVDAGGLLSYGTDLGALSPRLADFVHRILQGAKPADIPYEQLSTFKTVVNLRTAKAIGVKIPQSILLRADEVIE